MGKEEVIDYVMTTPGNPNKAVLSGMLDSIAQSGGTVEVSKIKIGTINGGFSKWEWKSTLDSSVISQVVFSGGGQLDGSEILELIGDKTIVNIEIIASPIEDPDKKYLVNAKLTALTPQYEQLSLIGASREEISSVTMGEAKGTISRLPDLNGKPGAADVYAICI